MKCWFGRRFQPKLERFSNPMLEGIFEAMGRLGSRCAPPDGLLEAAAPPLTRTLPMVVRSRTATDEWQMRLWAGYCCPIAGDKHRCARRVSEVGSSGFVNLENQQAGTV